MELPLGLQVVLIQDSKDHSHTSNTVLPNAGTCPAQALAKWGQILGGKNKDGVHARVCTHTHTSLNLCVLYGRIYILMEMYSAKWFWKQSSWLSKEECMAIKTASMPLRSPMKKTESRSIKSFNIH